MLASLYMSTVVRLHYETMFHLLSRKMSETRISFNYVLLILAYASLLINYFYSNCYSLIHDDFLFMTQMLANSVKEVSTQMQAICI